MRINTILLLIFSLTACQSSPDTSPGIINHARKYRLHETTLNKETAQRAVDIVNRLLSSEVPFRLHAHWSNQPLAKGKEGVPVYLIEIDPPGKFGAAFIPRGDRCIFIDANELPELKNILSQRDDAHPVTQERLGLTDEHLELALPEDETLALILLHETGHLFHGDWGEFSPDKAITEKGLNIDETESKKREIRADIFAGSQIRKAMQLPHGNPALREALALAIGINIIGMEGIARRTEQAEVSTDEPGSHVLKWDRGYSHYNLELRSLYMLREIDPTGPWDKNIQDYIVSRQGGARTSQKSSSSQSSTLPKSFDQ
jgi:hypothetical protein